MLCHLFTEHVVSMLFQLRVCYSQLSLQLTQLRLSACIHFIQPGLTRHIAGHQTLLSNLQLLFQLASPDLVLLRLA